MKALELMSAMVVVAMATTTTALATQPCGDFGECKTLVEINATDGDIGFHFLADGDDLRALKMWDPSDVLLYRNQAPPGALRDQMMTENFLESAEPLCWEDPDADEDELIVTLEEFLERWDSGTYRFGGSAAGGELAEGESVLTHDLPAAPADVDFDGSVVSWAAGDDLGNCASFAELTDLVTDGILPSHPVDVPVASWEVVFEPDVEDGDLTKSHKYAVRVAGDISVKEVTVPADYLASLPDDTPVKIEVGAIGFDDNATFTEADGFCVNEVDGCEEE